MRFSMNSWPPVASHFVCLLIGFFLGGLASKTKSQWVQFPKNSLVFTVDRAKVPTKIDETLTPNSAVSLVKQRSQKNGRWCRVHGRGMKFFHADDDALALRIHPSDAVNLLVALKSANKEFLVLKSLDEGAVPSPWCYQEPRISYAQ